MKIQDDDELLTVQDAAKRTTRKVATWRKDIHLKKVAVVRIGRQVRIPLSEIRRLIAKGYSPAATR